MEKENLLTSPQLLEFLQISRGTLTKLLREGIPFIKIGADYRFEKEKVISYLKTKVERLVNE